MSVPRVRAQGSLKNLKIAGKFSKPHALALFVHECEPEGDARVEECNITEDDFLVLVTAKPRPPSLVSTGALLWDKSPPLAGTLLAVILINRRIVAGVYRLQYWVTKRLELDKVTYDGQYAMWDLQVL